MVFLPSFFFRRQRNLLNSMIAIVRHYSVLPNRHVSDLLRPVLESQGIKEIADRPFNILSFGDFFLARDVLAT